MNGSRVFLICALAAVVLLSLQAPPAMAATFTVDSTGDAGDATPDGVCDSCTLREAIQEANFVGGADVIDFNIPPSTDPGCVVDPGSFGATGVCTIAPGTALPTITEAVTIDGFTQPGASANHEPGDGGQ